MQFYALVYFLNIHSTEIDIFRKKHDPKWNVIPPHITLVFPFSDFSEYQILEHVKKVTQDIMPFPIHLHGLQKIEDELIFLLVKEGNEEIMHVHVQLYSGIFQTLEQEFVFEPHITIGELPSADIDSALEEAEALDLDIHATFDFLSLVKGDGISPANIVGIVELG
ncbi:2'-5' RNA ligase family protein [Candidatus Woesebacteria bacterium]|nr:2'-5' RNA ligase family protein [Candidatus Woesebacteria bacterium]